MTTPLPFRPRLADYAAVRRHRAGEEAWVIVHDLRSNSEFRLPERAWDLVAHADGTRDEGGILLALARAGLLERRSEVRALLDHLHALGLLTDGVAPRPAPAGEGADRPIVALPDYRLACDGSGWCCRFYPSIAFSRDEARRAVALAPDRADFERFPPVASSTQLKVLAAPLDRGRCTFLTDAGRCSVEDVGGRGAKPRGCRLYPATFADDGDAVRVSIVGECACVFEPDLEHGAPLVPEAAARRRDLEAGIYVPEVPAEIAVADGVRVERAAIVAWTAAISSAPIGDDAAGALWALAASVEGGLDAARSLAVLGTDARVDAAGVLPFVRALAARAGRRSDEARATRDAFDLARAAAGWLARAAERLTTDEGLAAALAERRYAADERLYVRAMLHGYHCLDVAPLSLSLRDRATCLLLARALGPVLEVAQRGEAPLPGAKTAAHPLAVAEAMMRSYGIRGYVETLRS